MGVLDNKRGMTGWILVASAFFVWLVIVTIWYDPKPALDLSDNTNIIITLWWTIVCAVSVFVGLKIEKNKSAGL